MEYHNENMCPGKRGKCFHNSQFNKLCTGTIFRLLSGRNVASVERIINPIFEVNIFLNKHE